MDVGIPLAVMTYYNTSTTTVTGASPAGSPPPGSSPGSFPTCRSRSPVRGARRRRGRGRNRDARRAHGARRAPGPDLGRARGFVYAVGLLGVTGERSGWRRARPSWRPGKAVTDFPRSSGWGCPTRSRPASRRVADGVVQGASVVRRLMERDPTRSASMSPRSGPRSTLREEWVPCEQSRPNVRAVRGGADHPLVPRGRCVGSRSASLRGADGRLAPTRGLSAAASGPRCTAGSPVVEQHFGYEHYVDEPAQHPEHYHAHPRPIGGFFGQAYGEFGLVTLRGRSSVCVRLR